MREKETGLEGRYYSSWDSIARRANQSEIWLRNPFMCCHVVAIILGRLAVAFPDIRTFQRIENFADSTVAEGSVWGKGVRSCTGWWLFMFHHRVTPKAFGNMDGRLPVPHLQNGMEVRLHPFRVVSDCLRRCGGDAWSLVSHPSVATGGAMMDCHGMLRESPDTHAYV